MAYRGTIDGVVHSFDDLATLLARATPRRAADELAEIAASSAEERAIAAHVLADVPLADFLAHPLVPPEDDEVSRLILAQHDAVAFAPVRSLTVGELREWLLDDARTDDDFVRIRDGLTPEMVSAVAKLMRNQDLVLVARRCRVVTRFRTTLGLEGRLSTRLQPNHPTDDPRGIFASVVDGLLLGSGDATVGINPASDGIEDVERLVRMLDRVRTELALPIQSCVLCHVSTTMDLCRRGAPVDLVFQSIGGTEGTNTSFGTSIAMLDEAHALVRSLGRASDEQNVMYFETGQGSALSAGAHRGLDAQTCEVRAYAVAKRYRPLLVNTVVGFIGPEYLRDGKQILRAGLEDHFAGKLLGLPMGCDVCYTNHADADQDDMDTLLTLLAAAGCTYFMGIPGADDVMLGYQSTSFHDALYLRRLFGLRPAPEFEAWLTTRGIFDGSGTRLLDGAGADRLLGAAMALLPSGDAAGGVP